MNANIYHGELTCVDGKTWWATMFWRNDLASPSHGKVRITPTTSVAEVGMEVWLSVRYAVALRATGVSALATVLGIAARMGIEKSVLVGICNDAKWIRKVSMAPAGFMSSYEIGQEPFDRQYGDYEGRGDGSDETCNDTAGEVEMALA